MTTYSTAHTTQARRTPPRSQEKRSSKEQQPDNEALLIIDSEPEQSNDGPDWYYFWYKVPGQKNNANGSGKTINCQKFQVSWVKEAMESNTLLEKGLHFDLEKIATPGGPSSHRYRYVLHEDFRLDEPEPEEPPMTWSQPGQEVPVVVQPPQALIDVQTDEIAVETLRRFNRFRCCCTAAGLKPTPSELIAAMQANHSSVCIDASKGVTIRQRNS